MKTSAVNRLCNAKGIWLEGKQFWLLVPVIIKVKVSAPLVPPRLRPRPTAACSLTTFHFLCSPACLAHHLQPANPPSCWYSAAAVQHYQCGKTAAAAENFLRAHSALGLETRPTEMECFLMTGSSTRGREGLQHWRRCWCTRGQ